MKKKIIIIGGGASGMTAAIVAAQKASSELEICILEKNEKLGKKLLATGNGRCNFTNIDCHYDDFLQQSNTEKGQMTEKELAEKDRNLGGFGLKSSESDSFDFQRTAIGQFPPQKTLRFFAGLGVLARIEDEGRVYPYSGQGAVIQSALVRKIEELGISVQCGCTVKEIRRTDQGFQVVISAGEKDQEKTLTADAVILAAGGKAGLQYGTNGDGFALAKSLGHGIHKPIPALVPVLCSGKFLSGTKGVRARGEVTLCHHGIPVASDEGEIQFTGDGLSGICVFNISRFIQWSSGTAPEGYEIRIDFCPELSDEDIFSLQELGRSLQTETNVVEFLSGVVNEKLAVALLNELGVDCQRKMGAFSEEELKEIGRKLKGWSIPVTGTRSWKDAQVTCGGVKLDEVDPETMESRLIEGLYMTGELLDIDSRCGGFNLQWAWCTGYIAGSASVKESYA